MNAKWDHAVPKRTIGNLSPLGRIKYEPYEFNRVAPKGVLNVYIPIGLSEFSATDVERVFEPIDNLVDQMLVENVDIIIQGGVPLPCLIGVEAQDRLLNRMAERSGLPVSSTVTAVTRAARHLGIKNIAIADKWTDAMNAVLAEFFARDGVKVAGVSSEPMAPVDFIRMDVESGMALAYELGRRAIEEHPDCDGLYVGGGAWLVLPVVEVLEREYGIPCISNVDCQIWDALHRIDFWTPTEGSTRLLAGS
jgi:maleate cis-trans isomerase